MTFVDTSNGLDPDGNSSSFRKDGIAEETTTPLGANGTYSTGWIETTGYKEIYAVVFSDAASASNGLTVEYSNNGTTVLDSASRSFTTLNDFSRSSFPVTTKFIRYTYVNGSVAQTKFQLTVSLLTTPLGSSKTTLANSVNGLALAETTRGPIEQPTTATGNDFGRVTRTVSGDKNALDVNVTNPSSTSVDTSTLSKDSTLKDGSQKTQVVDSSNTSLGTASNPIRVNPTGTTTQPVSGNVTVTPPTAATVTTVNTTTNSTTIAAANANRKGLIINSVSGTILIKEGTGASATSYTYRIVTNGYAEFPKPVYTGIVTAIGAGQVIVTEEV